MSDKIPINIETIRNLIDHDYQVSASCLACRWKSEVDLDKAGKAIGFDSSYVEKLRPALKCRRCGAAYPQLTLIPPY